jgi:hypothetical protein
MDINGNTQHMERSLNQELDYYNQALSSILWYYGLTLMLSSQKFHRIVANRLFP